MTAGVAGALAAAVLLALQAAVRSGRRGSTLQRLGVGWAAGGGDRRLPRLLPALVTGRAPVVAAALAAGAAGLAVGGPGLAGLSAAAVVVARRVASRRAARMRVAAVDGDLPVVLEAVAARARAGGSLAQAVAEAGPPAGGLLAEQWRRLVELAPAVGLAAALDDWASRSGRRSVCLVAAALALAGETGGPPARAVDGVAATVRSRQAVAGELRALTAQARASAAVMVVAPVAFAGLGAAADPRTAAFLRTPVGVAMVAAGLGLDALGAAWMARLCRLRGEP